MRTWEFAVALDPEHARPLYSQLARAIIADIQRGRLQPGEALPGSRTLAKSLNLHRNTVLAGYAELAAEGWVSTERAGKTFVSRELPSTASARPAGVAKQRGPGYPLLPSVPVMTNPSYPSGTLVLTRGVPDVRLFPSAALARAYRRAFIRSGRNLLTYGSPRGHFALRTELATMLSDTRGIATTPDSVMVTRGSQMAVDLVGRALLQPGDVVAVEALGHQAAWQSLALNGARLMPIALDSGGMDVDALGRLAAKERVRAVYLTPHHQFPTTTVMPASRRLQLLELARVHRFAIFEDDYDHEFHYQGRPLLPLASNDPEGVVIYIGTLSKSLAPGLRIGFVVAPEAVLARMESLRVIIDLQGDLTAECAIAELFEDGELPRHIRRMRRIYEHRRDALMEALHTVLPDVVRFSPPPGGMALWVEVEGDISVEAWAAAALAHGVVFRDARVYDFHKQPQPFIRLGFTAHDEKELGEAVRRMAKSLPLRIARK